MKILFLTQWFEPEPAFKGLDFAKALRDAEHDVQVLTGFPNYPEGRLYPGYRVRPVQREVCDGIPVCRVALYPSHDRSAVRRVLNYLSFALSASTLGLLNVEDVDVTYVYVPPATAILPAVLLRALRGTPYVVDVQDLWPDTVAATEMLESAMALKLLGVACRLGYSLAGGLSVLSPGFRRTLTARGIPSETTKVIFNWASEEDVLRTGEASVPADWPRGSGVFTVLFAGNMGRAQGLGAVVAAARILERRKPEVRLVLMGGGVEVSALKRAAADLSNVTFLERRSRDQAARCLLNADALLVHLEEMPLFEITIPSKIQTYLAAGIPIVIGVRGDAADLVLEAGAGVTCRPGDPESIAEAVCALASMPVGDRAEMGARGRRFYAENMSRARGVKATIGLLEAVIA